MAAMPNIKNTYKSSSPEPRKLQGGVLVYNFMNSIFEAPICNKGYVQIRRWKCLFQKHKCEKVKQNAIPLLQFFT